MTDCDITIALHDGTEVDVIYPHRLGIEYDTPWLSHDGSRNWNIDIEECLTRNRSGRNFGINPRFVVGMWGTGYGDGRYYQMIPLKDVRSWRSLSDELLQISQRQREEDMRKMEEAVKADPNRCVRGDEFSALVRRVEELEAWMRAVRNLETAD